MKDTPTGTFACKLFGHKFKGTKIVYEPHYLKAVELGIAMTLTQRDYHLAESPLDYCARCGISQTL